MVVDVIGWQDDLSGYEFGVDIAASPNGFGGWATSDKGSVIPFGGATDLGTLPAPALGEGELV